MISVAVHSIFQLFLTDEGQVANLQLWKNLLLRTYRKKLWDEEIDGQRVQVWGCARQTSFHFSIIRLADHNLNWRDAPLADVEIAARGVKLGRVAFAWLAIDSDILTSDCGIKQSSPASVRYTSCIFAQLNLQAVASTSADFVER